jgi:hypothetical protein
MPRFYSKEEFQAQLDELIEQGLSPAQALKQVQMNEDEDRREYEEWLDKHHRGREWDD